ncbi:hypothetical protein GC209_01640 [bacterium]|nr:hypothetical protein [bacterium]
MPVILACAFAVLGSQRPRPVHIGILLDTIMAEMGDGPFTQWALPTRPSPAPTAVAAAASLMALARRPIIAAGGDAVGAVADLRARAEHLGTPVFMTINDKGILPAGHPLILSGNLDLQAMRDEMAACDVILAMGNEFGETEMYPEPHPLRINSSLIRIDIEPLHLTNLVPATPGIVSDAELACTALLATLRAAGPARRQGATRTSQLRHRIEADLWPACKTDRALMAAIVKALPDAVIASDQTEPVYAANPFHQAARPKSCLNLSLVYGTLGHGLPAVLGAGLGAPRRPSVCLIGDGGLRFSLAELASAVAARVGSAIIVWNNASYGEIKTMMAERGISPISVDLLAPDFVTRAEAMGCHAMAPTDLAGLKTAQAASALRDVPTLIEFRDPSALAQAFRSRDGEALAAGPQARGAEDR